MNCHLIFLLEIINIIIFLQSCDCSNVATEFTSSESESHETTENETHSEYGITISKLEPKDKIPEPYIVCHEKGEKFLKSLEDMEESCAEHHGKIEKGTIHYELAYLEPVTAAGNDEAWDLYSSAKPIVNSRTKRVKRRYTRDTEVSESYHECYGCVTEDNVVIFEDFVEIKNETTEDCKDGLLCDNSEMPNYKFDLVLAAVVSFSFCVLLLGILSCYPIILDGNYIPIRHLPCTRRSQSLMKVRYRNDTFDENDFSIVDFE